MRTTTFPSLGAFYAADVRRRRSTEHDVGLWWRDLDHHGRTFRAAWVQETGEVYAMQHEGRPGGGRVVVLGHAERLEQLETLLEGWEVECGEPGSIHWLVDRLRRLPVRRGAARAPAAALSAP